LGNVAHSWNPSLVFRHRGVPKITSPIFLPSWIAPSISANHPLWRESTAKEIRSPATRQTGGTLVNFRGDFLVASWGAVGWGGKPAAENLCSQAAMQGNAFGFIF